MRFAILSNKIECRTVSKYFDRSTSITVDIRLNTLRLTCARARCGDRGPYLSWNNGQFHHPGGTPTSFDQGLSRFTWLMIQLMAVMVPLVFFINGFTKHDWKGAFFFAMAVAVGLTPEMLPMIVSVCLSKGALAMSRKKVIVKRLNAIQNFGGMDVLCTDKTGTLTEDRVVLQRHCNVAGRETDEVLRDGYLISHFQTG